MQLKWQETALKCEKRHVSTIAHYLHSQQPPVLPCPRFSAVAVIGNKFFNSLSFSVHNLAKLPKNLAKSIKSVNILGFCLVCIGIPYYFCSTNQNKPHVFRNNVRQK